MYTVICANEGVSRGGKRLVSGDFKVAKYDDLSVVVEEKWLVEEGRGLGLS